MRKRPDRNFWWDMGIPLVAWGVSLLAAIIHGALGEVLFSSLCAASIGFIGGMKFFIKCGDPALMEDDNE
jgi:hypothetical protein